MHRHPPCYHPSPSWGLPKIWLQGGVLDHFGSNHLWISPWNYLCYLYYHQVITLYLMWTMKSCVFRGSTLILMPLYSRLIHDEQRSLSILIMFFLTSLFFIACCILDSPLSLYQWFVCSCILPRLLVSPLTCWLGTFLPSIKFLVRNLQIEQENLIYVYYIISCLCY